MKPWSKLVADHVVTWSGKLATRGLDWWPRFVYHYTDVNNAVQILSTGRLLSRAEAQRQGAIATDSACRDVISQTRAQHLEYVRFYFRPRTPTQYRNEGIRPAEKRWNDAHCPIPVFLCFGATQILSLDHTEYSNGNMGSSHVLHGPNQADFERIPFGMVFHDSWVSPDERDTVVFHRHAEVLVPTACSLEPTLVMIVCRSAAERLTLLHLLPPASRRKWGDKIRLGYEGLFFRKWTYVESVSVDQGVVEFRFNPNTTVDVPHQIEFSYVEEGATSVQVWSGQRAATVSVLRIRVRDSAQRGEATLRIDGCLAFAGNVSFVDIPF